jgi:hypothetical protein
MSLLRRTLTCVALSACANPSYRSGPDGLSQNDAGDAGAASLQAREGGTRAEAGSAPPEAGRVDATTGADDAAITVLLEEDVGPRTAALPAWAAALRGPYASRAFMFKQDDFGTLTRAALIRLHQFELVEDGLVLRSKICEYLAQTMYADSWMVDPSAAPEQEENVLFSDTEQRWSTDGLPVQYGFTRALPAICDGKVGETVNKPASHVWTTSTRCRCAEVDEEPLADDCRVLDPDEDGHPGFTFHLMGTSIPGVADVFGGYESASRLANGQLRADGTLHANVRAAETNYQFGCLPDGCSNIAVLGKWCPSSLNSIDFVPLTNTDPSCDAVLATRETLFPMDVPDYPPRCFQ